MQLPPTQRGKALGILIVATITILAYLLRGLCSYNRLGEAEVNPAK